MTRPSQGGRGALVKPPRAAVAVSVLLLALGATAAQSTSRLMGSWKILGQEDGHGVRYRLLAGVLESNPDLPSSFQESLRELKPLCIGSIDPRGSWYFLLTETPLDQEGSERILAVTRGIGGTWHHMDELVWMAAINVSEGPEGVVIAWVLMSSPSWSMQRFYAFETRLASIEPSLDARTDRLNLLSQAVDRELETPRFEARVQREGSCFPTEISLETEGKVWSIRTRNPDFQRCGEYELTLDRSGDSASWRVFDRLTGIVKSPGDPSPEKWPPIEVFDTDGCEAFESSK